MIATYGGVNPVRWSKRRKSVGYLDVSVSKRLIITTRSSFVSMRWRSIKEKGVTSGGIGLILGLKG